MYVLPTFSVQVYLTNEKKKNIKFQHMFFIYCITVINSSYDNITNWMKRSVACNRFLCCCCCNQNLSEKSYQSQWNLSLFIIWRMIYIRNCMHNAMACVCVCVCEAVALSIPELLLKLKLSKLYACVYFHFTQLALQHLSLCNG